MSPSTPLLRGVNLTEIESLALSSQLNMADGHARQELTKSQRSIVDELPDLFAKAAAQPVDDLEREAHRAYLHLLHQHSYPTRPGGVLTCYSSSVAMEILARSLVPAGGGPVALVHPTFDNIPDLLRGNGLRLLPVEEDVLHEGSVSAAVPEGVRCLFITTPNNPTGRVLAEQRLAAIAAECAARDVVLALDTSFRGFDTRSHYDHYTVLRDSGCRWVVIEDTGKLWATLDLKVGLLASSDHVGLPLAKIHSDILLGVSPFVLVLVTRFAEDAAAGGLADLHRFIADNRALVRATLADVPDLAFPDGDARVSVERVDLGERRCLNVWTRLRQSGIYVLPCSQFHWADPARGDHSLRIALARVPGALEAAVRALRAVLLSP
ncbi:enduracididine biosynthesis enzyme MppP [Micromonospora maris]|uniref:enduracididine biosynthesis enzyme MppP n=1 Tax=Micromonospora maris TaxID=1003110 RepID=UPI002E110A9E|nr:enduracididine biosynthesis enzyme MppP [Micromonospora maris]